MGQWEISKNRGTRKSKALRKAVNNSYRRPTKVEPAPVAHPDGGGLKVAAPKTPESQKLEMDALLAKHEVEIAKLKEKHASANKPKPIKKPK